MTRLRRYWRLRRYKKKTLWAPGMLRRPKTVCFFLKWAEDMGIYD